MGDYTAVRFSAELSDWGFVQVQRLLEDHSWSRSEVPDLWKNQGRANFIPFGVVQTAPAEWLSDHSADFEDGFYNKNSVEGKTWSVFCSVKDDGVVEAFLTVCLPRLIKNQVRVETYFELDADVKIHEVNAMLV